MHKYDVTKGAWEGANRAARGTRSLVIRVRTGKIRARRSGKCARLSELGPIFEESLTRE